LVRAPPRGGPVGQAVSVAASAGWKTPRAVYSVGRVNCGVTVTGGVSVKAGVVPKAAEPLQSNSTNPDEPVTTEETFGVRVVQLLVSAGVVAGIAGKVCVKRVVAA